MDKESMFQMLKLSVTPWWYVSASNDLSLQSHNTQLTEFGYERSESGIQKMCDTLRNVMVRGPHAIRSLGSGVLDLCYLAAGRLDAIYAGVAGESWCPWDYCAGWLMIEEAGGVLMTLDRPTDRQFYMYSKSLLAVSSISLGNELYEIIGSRQADGASS
jgi:fructose-1,6-bisphosphatase/inositol monophosphatase family enzyme